MGKPIIVLAWLGLSPKNEEEILVNLIEN